MSGFEVNWTGFSFGTDAQCMAVFDKAGNPIGITVKVGDYPLMMFPLVAIPDESVRFDAERPR